MCHCLHEMERICAKKREISVFKPEPDHPRFLKSV